MRQSNKVGAEFHVDVISKTVSVEMVEIWVEESGTRKAARFCLVCRGDGGCRYERLT